MSLSQRHTTRNAAALAICIVMSICVSAVAAGTGPIDQQALGTCAGGQGASANIMRNDIRYGQTLVAKATSLSQVDAFIGCTFCDASTKLRARVFPVSGANLANIPADNTAIWTGYHAGIITSGEDGAPTSFISFTGVQDVVATTTPGSSYLLVIDLVSSENAKVEAIWWAFRTCPNVSGYESGSFHQFAMPNGVGSHHPSETPGTSQVDFVFRTHAAAASTPTATATATAIGTGSGSSATATGTGTSVSSTASPTGTGTGVPSATGVSATATPPTASATGPGTVASTGSATGTGIAAGTGTASNEIPCRFDDSINPNCKWECDDPQCPSVCHPVCEQPKCVIQCEKTNCAICSVNCDKPVCTIRCPKTCVNGTNCPKCVHACEPAKCHTTCKAPTPQCAPVCEELNCRHRCIKPECARPKCSLKCEQSKCLPQNKACCPCSASNVQHAMKQATQNCGAAGCTGTTPSFIETMHNIMHQERISSETTCCPCNV
jgi:hypothetical protein